MILATFSDFIFPLHNLHIYHAMKWRSSVKWEHKPDEESDLHGVCKRIQNLKDIPTALIATTATELIWNFFNLSCQLALLLSLSPHVTNEWIFHGKFITSWYNSRWHKLNNRIKKFLICDTNLSSRIMKDARCYHNTLPHELEENCWQPSSVQLPPLRPVCRLISSLCLLVQHVEELSQQQSLEARQTEAKN